MLKITYLAKLKEQLATSEETIDWAGGHADDLIALLRQRGSPWEEALAPGKIYKLAINQSIVHNNAYIPAQAEVAFLPPVTGG
jgi:molybdopterin synthase sulfur carrier subunit